MTVIERLIGKIVESSVDVLHIICRMVRVLFKLFVFASVELCPLHIVLCFCFVFLVYTMLPVSLDCPFLIAPSVFSSVNVNPSGKILHCVYLLMMRPTPYTKL
jgi:hypothetical protein